MEPAGLYMRYAPMVFRRCRQLLKDEDNARDAMQDVFAKVLSRPELSVEFPSSFLYTAATRICLDRIRSAETRLNAGSDLLEEIAAVGDLEEKTLAGRILDRLFDREQQSSRVIAVLHLVDGLTLEETAEEVGLSISGVRRRLTALKARLQAMTKEVSR